MSNIASSQSPFARVLSLMARIGADPGDSDDARLRKALFVGAVLLGAIPPAILLGVVLAAFGESLVGWLLFTFSTLSLVIVIVFAFGPQHYQRLLFAELLLVLLIPFLITLALGTPLNLVGMLWSFMCPLGALVMSTPKSAWRWFLAYLCLFAVAVALQPYLRQTSNLPPAVGLVTAATHIAGTSTVTFILLHYFARQKTLFQEKADTLLLNILPEEIAAILKNESRTIANYYENASILFADVVNFTPLSAQLTPTELVDLLNEVFSYFDTLTERYGLEKIKTIGDCYMVAAGVPRPRPDHAQVLVAMALDIRDYVSQHEFRGKKLVFRLGLNSGPAVAGVIGRKKFIYDVWGDTVNTASRMESHGKGGVIQISETTYELIQNDFICEPHGTVNVKGKGAMTIWHVIGRKR